MHTGDLAIMDGQGYCSIVGRIKDMVRGQLLGRLLKAAAGGFRRLPEAVGATAAAHWAQASAAATAVVAAAAVEMASRPTSAAAELCCCRRLSTGHSRRRECVPSRG